MEALIILIGIVTSLVILDVVAVLVGADSRDGFGDAPRPSLG